MMTPTRVLILSVLVLAPATAVAAETAPTLDDVRALNEAGRYREAEPVARALLAGLESEYGPESPEVADALDELVETLLELAESTRDETIVLAERVVALKTDLYGEESAETATSLYRLAEVLRAGGDPRTAYATHRRALDIRERVLGPDHPDVAYSLVSTGRLAMGVDGTLDDRPAYAYSMYDRAQAIFERAEGERSLGVAFVLRAKGDWHGVQREPEEAIALHRRSADIRAEILGPDHPSIGMNYNSMGIICKQIGRYDEAEVALREAMRIWEASLGPDHPNLGYAYLNWAHLFWFGTVDVADARAALERALEIRERRYGPVHPDIAGNLDHLGGLLTYLGEDVEARAMFERGLAIREETLGPDDYQLFDSLVNIAECDLDIGDRASALPLLQRAVSLVEAKLGPDHVRLAYPLGHIGRIQLEDGNLEQAEAALERAVAVLEGKPAGPSAIAAGAYHALAEVRVRQGRFEEAMELDERAIKLRVEVMGPDHFLVASSLRAAAQTLEALGREDEALERLERALRILEVSYGADHRKTASVRYDVAVAALRTGDGDRAFREGLHSETDTREHMRLAARGLSERQALTFATSRRSGADLALAVLVGRETEHDQETVRQAWDAVVRSRALVLDEMASRHREIGASANEELVGLSEKLGTARRRLANFALHPPEGGMHAESYRAKLRELQDEKERLEVDLGRRSIVVRRDLERTAIGLDDALAALPDGAALIAFVRFDRVGRGKSRPVPWYAALVHAPHRAGPVLVSLGDAHDIDRLVAAWRAELRSPPSPIVLGGAATSNDAGVALREAVWDPVAKRAGDAARWFIVPDGALYEVSFAALPLVSMYLVERGPTLHYLSSERDLVREEPKSRGATLLAIGAPDFDWAGTAETVAEGTIPSWLRERLAGSGQQEAVYRGRTADCTSASVLQFGSIPEARTELREIASLWKDHVGAPDDSVATLVDAAAREGWFKRLAPGRGALHIATHGFFADPSCEGANGDLVDDATAGPRDGSPTARSPNPLLLSGLALAGANRGAEATSDGEDGILTAEEIAALDLSSVGWAVLSACDTGRGDIVSGEGVLGLRRAFEIAGADTLVLSLWRVDDAAARAWMRALYRRRLDGASTSDAVRRASLDILEERREAGVSDHPFYWAGFIATGDWR